MACAPTNNTVVEMVMQLLKLARESNRSNCHWIGDIVSVGTEGRLRLQNYEQIFDVCLEYRVTTLTKCFSEWKDLLDSMVCLLEDPAAQYLVFQKKMKRIKRDKKKSRTKKEEADALDHNKESKGGDGENTQNEEILSLGEYVSKNFNRIYNELRLCIVGLCNNLPSPLISEVAEDMNTVLGLLESVKTLLCGDTISDEEMNKMSVPCEQFTSDPDEEDPLLTILGKQRKSASKFYTLFLPSFMFQMLIMKVQLGNSVFKMLP
ncbi:hypothetical protein Sjap_014626 [Stephania japonica]|uniref:Uncharacterized protein n=1 Tax=Stephania japonica TaxID=461633 RepID=A0AAP0IHL5_9MAGN